MPRVAKQLTDKAVRALNKPGFHAVGGVPGLCLQIPRSGNSEEERQIGNLNARSWVLRATMSGRLRSMGLGPYPEVSLAKARDEAKKAREVIRAGRDPIEERKADKRKTIEEDAKRITFREAAEQCHAKKAPEMAEGSARIWINSLKNHVFPHIGNIPVGEITFDDVLKVLRPIWKTKTGGTAANVRARIESVLTWAMVSGYREKGDNPARWDGNLKEVFATTSRIHTVRHRKALPWQEMPAFAQKLEQGEDAVSRAAMFTILTASRPAEATMATWSEIDFDRKVWEVPAERMKTRKPHRVPLSDAALNILQQQAADQPDDENFVFPGSRRGKPVTPDRLVNKAKEVSGDPELTMHGFRSSFKDWCRSRTRFPDEVSELALAHVNSDATRAAYARDELLPQRAKLMQAWATFLRSEVKPGEVVDIRRDQVRS